MVRGIVFDLFDTLVDQNHDRLPPIDVDGRLVSASTPALHRHMVDNMDLDLSLGEFVRLQREVDRDLFRATLKQDIELPTLERFDALVIRLVGRRDLDLAEELTGLHMDLLRSAVTVPEHHESLLASLAVDHALAVCSNFSHAPTARGILEEANLSRHLSSIVISEEVGIRKPRPEIFEAVFEALDLLPSEVLHVGDSLRADVAGAARCGMRTVWLTRHTADPDAELARYVGPRPDFALEDLMDLAVLAARLSA